MVKLLQVMRSELPESLLKRIRGWMQRREKDLQTKKTREKSISTPFGEQFQDRITGCETKSGQSASVSTEKHTVRDATGIAPT